MKCIVIYHSITGNTRIIAEAIQHGLIKFGESCDIARVNQVDTSDLLQYKLIGLGSPVMWRRELYNLTDFIEYTMQGVEGKHCFAFCTHGATPAHYLSRVVPALKQKGMTVIGWNDWFGSVSFPCVPKPYFTDGQDINEAERFGFDMAEKSNRIYSGEKHLIPELPRGGEYDEIYDPILSKTPAKDVHSLEIAFANSLSQPFKVNKQKCKYPKCTFCIDNCPLNAIDFSSPVPLFSRKCDRCFMCEMACPQGAIEFDYKPFDKLHTVRPGESPLEKTLEVFEGKI